MCFFPFYSFPHHYSIKSRGTAGGWFWFVSSSQTLLLINGPCFIYMLRFGVIFPHWNRMRPNLQEGTYPQALTLSLSEQDPWYLNQWSRVLRRVLFWSPEHLQTRGFEKSPETMGQSFSLPPLSKWLVSGVTSDFYRGFKPTLHWEKSKLSKKSKVFS